MIRENTVDIPHIEKWLEFIHNSETPACDIKIFCHNYYYFSLQQVLAFSKVISIISCFDNNALAVLAETLFDELGRGDPRAVHSVIFKRFVDSVSLDPQEIPSRENVLSGVNGYVDELSNSFSSGCLPRALATYLFLEKSACECYAPLYKTISARFPNLTEGDLEFFELHANLEPEHEKAAKILIDSQNFSEKEWDIFNNQFSIMATRYEDFWRDIYNGTVKYSDSLAVLQENC